MIQVTKITEVGTEILKAIQNRGDYDSVMFNSKKEYKTLKMYKKRSKEFGLDTEDGKVWIERKMLHILDNLKSVQHIADKSHSVFRESFYKLKLTIERDLNI